MKKIFTVIVLSVVALTSCTNNKEYVNALFEEMYFDMSQITMEYISLSSAYEHCPSLYDVDKTRLYFQYRSNIEMSEDKVTSLENDIERIELELLKAGVSQKKIDSQRKIHDEIIGMSEAHKEMLKYFGDWIKK